MADEVDTINFIVSEYSYEKFMMMFILGTTGDAMDYKMNFFFTFWGLFNLKKKGIPKGKPKVRNMPWNLMPPMSGLATKVFKKKMKNFGIEDPLALLKEGVEGGNIKLIPCQMTMDLMGIKIEDMYDFVSEPVGAATFLEMNTGPNTRIVSL